MSSDDASMGHPTGLTSAEVAERVANGLTNAYTETTSRTVWAIVRDNVFTLFDAILIVLLVAILAFGSPADALFGFVIVANAAIGITQELRAKRVLDRISVLTTPRATVVRDGTVSEIGAREIVADDVVRLAAGDQVPVDGDVLASTELEIDEALITGESLPVKKSEGASVLSGSVVVAGSGWMRATAVGDAAYARKLAAEARTFQRAPSELTAGTNRILAIISWLMAPVAAIVIWSQVRAGGNVDATVTATVGALVGMIPQGLVLLTSMAFAVSVIRLARQNAIVDQLPSVEGLARVDVVCVDKTGTLTEPALQVRSVEPLDSDVTTETTARALGALARIDPEGARNATAVALAAEFPDPGETPSAQVPFSSARKYSAVALPDGAWLLGAPDVLLPEGDPTRERANEWAAQGLRVLLLATAPGLPGDDERPRDLHPVAAILVEERIRPDAADTLAYFRTQGVQLRVISGDNPVTVATVAERVGLERLGDPFDAQLLPEDIDELAGVMETHNVFGRVRPEQKRLMVRALKRSGHTVAMTGDGVNDVLALKEADVGIAMGSGAPATRAVARLVLLDGRFAVLPDVVREGRRVIANIERVANLFVTKSVYAAVLSVVIGLTAYAFPLLPRHYTVIGVATIGIPGAVLALGLLAPRYRPGFLPRVARFTLVSGVTAGLATLAVYITQLTRGTPAADARTATVLTLSLIGLWVLAIISRPWTAPRIALVAGMGVFVALAFTLPLAQEFFALPPMQASAAVLAFVTAAVAAVVIEVGLKLTKWENPATWVD